MGTPEKPDPDASEEASEEDTTYIYVIAGTLLLFACGGFIYMIDKTKKDIKAIKQKETSLWSFFVKGNLVN